MEEPFLSEDKLLPETDLPLTNNVFMQMCLSERSNPKL